MIINKKWIVGYCKRCKKKIIGGTDYEVMEDGIVHKDNGDCKRK